MSTPTSRSSASARLAVRSLALVPALLAACADDPISAPTRSAAYPPGPTVTGTPTTAFPPGPTVAGPVPAGGVNPGCPGICTFNQARILFADSTGFGVEYSVNPDGSGYATEHTGIRGGTWNPAHDGYVASAGTVNIVADLYSYAVGNPNWLHRYTASAASDVEPAISPDGMTIAFASDRASAPGKHEIFAMPINQQQTGTGIIPLTLDNSDDRWPHWSPDGAHVVYASTRAYAGLNAGFHLWRVDADGWNCTILTTMEGRHPVYSPDGKRIAFTTATPAGERIAIMFAAGGRPTIVQNGLASSFQPSWSPDGKMIAFTSADPAWKGINVMNVDGTGVKRVWSFGSMPKWSR